MRDDQIENVRRRISERREAANQARSCGADARAMAIDSDTDMLEDLLARVTCLTIARDALREVIRDMGDERRAEVAERKAIEEEAKRSKGKRCSTPG